MKDVIAEAAEQIVALINSKPQTPTAREIAAVLTDAAAPATGGIRDTYLASAWRRALDRFLDEAARLADDETDDSDERMEKINRDIIAATRAVWAAPCDTFDAIILRACVTRHWWNNGVLGLPGEPGKALDLRSTAHLVDGILSLAGLRFDEDGRLLPEVSV